MIKLLNSKLNSKFQNCKNKAACYYYVTYKVQSESTLYSLPECEKAPCSKQAPYRKFK